MANPFASFGGGVPPQAPQGQAAFGGPFGGPFGAAAAPPPADNPFLAGGAAPPQPGADAPNPFAFAGAQPQGQAAFGGPFGGPFAGAQQPAAAAANPFGAPAAAPPPAAANPFGVAAAPQPPVTQSTMSHPPNQSITSTVPIASNPFGAVDVVPSKKAIPEPVAPKPQPPPPEPEPEPVVAAVQEDLPPPPPAEEELPKQPAQMEDSMPPPPPEEVEEVTEKLNDTQIADEKPETQEEKSEERKESVDMSNAKSMGGAIFGEEKTEEEQPEVPEENGQEEEKGYKPTMSTGAAIFADLPETEIDSTGATIFGTSKESAADSTGAKIFDVEAPRGAMPVHGAMTGWDDNFDKKFESAEAVAASTGGGYDPFGGGFGVGGYGDDSGGFGNSGGTDAFVNATSARNFDKLQREELEKNPFAEGVTMVEDFEEVLFDEDTSKPLEDFPRVKDKPAGWEMFIRYPPKKTLTANRYWKKIWVRLAMQGDNPCLQLCESKDAKQGFQEVPLQSTYSLSEISHQVFDQFAKIFTIKLQFVFYKERPGIRAGQINKMQKLTNKIGFLAKAVEDADYKGVKEFASDMKKLGIPLEHAPQVSEVLKLGCIDYEALKQFTVCIEEKLFKMDVHRDRSLTYKTEEVQLTAVEEVYVEQDKTGHVVKQICRVRVFFLSFLSDMPEVELGVNDLERMGLEVVGRHDILPVQTEQWIRYEDIEFHSMVDKKAFDKEDHIIKFQPPDACYVEVMRFRVRPPKARELPMQARCIFEITGNKVVIKADMLIPYPHTKAWGQVPCEEVAMRIPIPECWVYQFRQEKAHMSLGQLAQGNINIGSRMGAVKSAHRRAGKVKGLERFLGTLESQTQELMETSSGEAKYEHQHKAVVWRVPRLPKHGQGSYTNHEFVCKLTLQSFDQVPDNFDKHFFVEFNQPACPISNTVLRSVSIQGGSGEPPEKFVKYLARHEYKLEIEFTTSEKAGYLTAVRAGIDEKKKEEEERAKRADQQEDSDRELPPDFPDEDGRRFEEDSSSSDDE